MSCGIQNLLMMRLEPSKLRLKYVFILFLKVNIYAIANLVGT